MRGCIAFLTGQTNPQQNGVNMNPNFGFVNPNELFAHYLVIFLFWVFSVIIWLLFGNYLVIIWSVLPIIR